MYVNDLLEIKTNKNETFNLRIKDKCFYLNDSDIITFVLYDKENFKIFKKDFFIYEGVAYISFNNNDIDLINVGDYTYSIFAKIKQNNHNDTIIYKKTFKMEG